jgi:hypothetical protein
MTTAETTSTSKNPSHIAYSVRTPKGSEKGFWTRIGAAWPTKNGGFNIQLDTIPLDGHIALLLPSEKKD